MISDFTEEETPGCHAYQIYFALNLHFSDDSYDYFKYHGKLKWLTPKKYQESKGRFYFEMVAKNYGDNVFDYILSLVSHYDRKIWIGDLIGIKSKEIYNRWRDSLTSESLNHSLSYDVTLKNNEYSELLKAYFSDEITKEQMMFSLYKNKLYDTYDDTLKDDPIWRELSLKCKRYHPFLERFFFIH